VAVATSAGVGLFHLSWVAALNEASDFAAWNRIRVPREAYVPWWHETWSADTTDVSFGDDHTLYVVKATEGVWRLTFELDPANRTHRCLATAYYPGVSCGMNYTQMLHGWANPDLPTLHHPYGVVADGQTAYVTGWNGKVQRLDLAAEAGARIQNVRLGADHVDLAFWSPFGDRQYQVETTPSLSPPQWAFQADAQVRSLGNQVFTARLSRNQVRPLFYRIRVRP
jgi:hypothetical protein